MALLDRVLKGRARLQLLWLSVLGVLLLTVGYAILVAPGVRYTKIWLMDEMAITAAAYRVSQGQLPSLHFLSSAGVLTYFPIALGYHLGLSPGVVIGFGQIVTAAFLLLPAVAIAFSRFSLLSSAIVIVFLFLLIVSPLRLSGDPLRDITFATFYNRHGWAGLAILFMTYIEPLKRSTISVVRDSIAIALVLIYLFYSMMNFAASGCAFIIANALVSRYNRVTSIVALTATAAVVTLVGIVSPYESAYISDIEYVAKTHLEPINSLYEILTVLSGNEIYISLAVLSLAVLFLAGRRSLCDAIVLAAAIAGSLLLTHQSSIIAYGLPALISVIACFGEFANRHEGQNQADGRVGRVVSVSLTGLLVVFASQAIVSKALALYVVATTIGKIAPLPGLPPGLSGILVDRNLVYAEEDCRHHDGRCEVVAALRRKSVGPAEKLSTADYLATIIDGEHLVEKMVPKNRALIVFDMTDPFTQATGNRLTSYGFPFFWVDGAFSRTLHPEPEKVFSDASYVMVPDLPMSQSQLDMVKDLYEPYLKAHFEEVARSSYWHLWARKDDV